MLDASEDEKVRFVMEDRWIGYPRAKRILNRLDEMLALPRLARMPALLIVGHSNNGKTSLLRRFADNHPCFVNEDTGLLVEPVVYVSAPPRPDEKAFLTRILERLEVPFAKNDSSATKYAIATRHLRIRNTKALVIDEIQHILSGSWNNQRIFLNLIKDMANELGIVLVGAGVEEAYNAIQVDEQLANRFDVEALPRWRIDSKEEALQYAGLLSSMERTLPFPEPSDLATPKTLAAIHARSEGLIGETARIVRSLAATSIREGKSHVDISLLNKIDYVPPSKRKTHLRKLME